MKQNTTIELSYGFALSIMGVVKTIRERKEYELASQLWRSGTSIGANVEEAQAAQSRADFRSKMSIAAKEAREIYYWLKLAKDGQVISEKEFLPLQEQIGSMQKILTSIVKTTSENTK